MLMSVNVLQLIGQGDYTYSHFNSVYLIANSFRAIVLMRRKPRFCDCRLIAILAAEHE